MSEQPAVARPILFEPSFEQVPDDEAQTSAELVEAMHSILEKTLADYGHAVRSVHAKAHGVLTGTLTVPDTLSVALAQGAFARPGTFPIVMRLSTNPGDILDDKVSTPRGMAIKVLGVQGERLPGSDGDTTQDFVLQNAKAFTAATPAAFLKTLKLLAKTTDKVPRLKKAMSATLRGVEAAVEAVGGQSATLKSLGGHPLTHPLGETFYTVVPLLYGPYYAKLRVQPVSRALRDLTDQAVDLDGKPDGLREAVQAFFAEHDATWEIGIQLATDREKMPIEDASVVWPEQDSPYIAVAQIHVPRQPSWTAERITKVDEGMVFSPWHGLAAHRPLGGVMRVRRPAYEHSAEFRGRHRGCPIHEPRSLDDV